MTVGGTLKRYRLLSALAMGLGIASLCALPFTSPILNSNHLFLYHTQGNPTPVVGAVLLGVLLLWAIFASYCALATFVRPTLGRVLWLLLFSFLLGLATVIASFQLDIHVRGVYLYAPLLSLVALLTWLAVLGRNPARFDSLVRASQTVLVFIGMFGVFTLAQILYVIHGSWNLNPPPRLADATTTASGSASQAGNPSRAGNAARPRVIWILLDELSYQQVYGNRAVDLHLPAFDSLAHESVVFTDARPVGYSTDRIVPSLMTGQPVADIRSGLDGQLWIQPRSQSSWQRFQPENTIFSDARRQAFHIGIAGWYNPYCRILPRLLSECVCTAREFGEKWWNPNQAILPAARLLFTHLVLKTATYAHPQRTRSFVEMPSREADYDQLLSVADSMLRDPTLNLVFLHLPLPHPPGFYDRHTGAFTHTGTYLDNLVLADKTLAHLHDVLARQGQWDNSTIVLMGDHSWRVNLWKASPGWTAEEEHASSGVFDDRPAYIVKLPNQHTGTTIDSSYDALRTRDLFDHLFTGEITTPERLATWAGAPASTTPAPSDPRLAR